MVYWQELCSAVHVASIIIQLQPRRTQIITPDTDPRIERNMSLSDQTLVCRDCNQEFVFTVGEQEFFASRGLTNTPGRCPSCRSARRANGGNSRGGARGGSASREPRQMYSTTCSSCGNEALVPFQPRGDKPVYCSDCFQPQSSSGGGRGGNDRRSRW